MLEFTEEGHIYTWKGKKVRSVTQVLEPLYGYIGVPAHVLEAAAARGTAVHLACEYWDNGVFGGIEEELQPYLDAWIRFLEESKIEIEMVENRIYHPLYGYAGAIDRIAVLQGVRGIFDIKTTASLMPAAGPQLAAYLEAWNHTNPEVPAEKRFVVQLKPDGKYVLAEHTDKADFQTFLACQRVTKWRDKHVK